VPGRGITGIALDDDGEVVEYRPHGTSTVLPGPTVEPILTRVGENGAMAGP